MKISVSVKIPKLLSSPKELADELKRVDATAVADANILANKIKREYILQGRSPVQGKGQFKPYAKDRYNDPSKYPGHLKPSRPVNLKLSGEMLSFFKAAATQFSIKLGLINPNQKVKDRAQGNNLGNPDKNVPERRFIPVEGENWDSKVEKEIDSIVERNVNRNLKKLF